MIASSRDILEEALATATRMAQLELVTALREPARKIVTLLHNRAADLKEFEAVIVEETERRKDDRWGMF